MKHLPTRSFLSQYLGVLLGLLAVANLARAQAPGWAGASFPAGSQAAGTSSSKAAAADAQGNIFVVGSFTGKITFGSTLLVSAGYSDWFVAKYVPSTGTWAWAQRGGGYGDDYAQSIAVSSSGIYVAGYIINNLANSQGVTFGGPSSVTSPIPVSGATATVSSDMLLAKYQDGGPTGTYVWSQVGGGTGADYGNGVAVNGTSVYVTGSIQNNSADAKSVRLGGSGTTPGTAQVNGATTTVSDDLLLVKYEDNGATGSYVWSQVGGGKGSDFGTAVAASSSSVYVTGATTNSEYNANAVVFGGGGTTAGTVQVPSAGYAVSRDIVLVKYQDNGPTGGYIWSQAGGGIDDDYGKAVAVSGSNVYITGAIRNNRNNNASVVFGGGSTLAGSTVGTRPQAGTIQASVYTYDLVLAKYTDMGSAGSFGWSQVAGGADDDYGMGLVVSGNTVYVGGEYGTYNYPFEIQLGGSGTTPGTATMGGAFPQASPNSGNRDLLLARYTDNGATGSYAACQVGGGTRQETSGGLALSGNSVYLTGSVWPSSSSGYAFGTANVSALQGMSGNQALLAGATGGNWVSVAAATGTNVGGTSTTAAIATDASGNVFVAGTFEDVTTFGNIVLRSAGGTDWFVAKYVPSTGTWAWAQRGGGRANDKANGIAVSGTSVYVTGTINNDAADFQNVTFGGLIPANSPAAVAGATTTTSYDLVVVKYQDNGPTGTYVWSQVGGGTDDDAGAAVAASGSSVYVTGTILNNTTNAKAVVFGGSGTTMGTSQVSGATAIVSADMLLAKYQDNGSAGAYVWSQVGGGTASDTGAGVAVQGSSVYVTGGLVNNTSNDMAAVFGSSGTTAGTSQVNGASNTASTDMLLVKYQDNGPTGTYVWSQVGGGLSEDYGQAVAVYNTNLYVAGYLSNSASNSKAVVLGGGGTTPGTVSVSGATSTESRDLLLVKYTDQGATGSYQWNQVGGGTADDQALGVAAGNSSIYVTGYLTNNTANFNAVVMGGSGTTPGTVTVPGVSPSTSSGNSADLLLAKYQDNSASAALSWAQVGGGEGPDKGYGVVASGQQLLVAGAVRPPAAFGTATLGILPYTDRYVLAYASDTNLPLPTRPTASATTLALYPNPARGTTTLTGAAPAASIQVLDALGRVVATATADAGGTAQLLLPARLVSGIYIVRTDHQALRLSVE